MISPRFKLLHVLVIAVLVRLALFLAFQGTFDFVRTGQIHGSEAYDTYAVNLLDTGVFGRTPSVPDAAIPPLYAYALAGLYRLIGRGALQVVGFHIVLDVLSIALLADIGRRLYPEGKAVGLVAALALALYPYLIFQSLTVIDTPLFTALLHASIWLIVVLRDRARTDSATLEVAAFGGLAFGLATLTRPILLPFALLVPIWFAFRRSWLEVVTRLAPIALVGAILVGAWAARNENVYGRLVPMTTTIGSNFWQGNSPLTVPLFRAGYDVQWTAPKNLTARDPHSPEADEERFRLAVDYLRRNPGRIPELLGVKFLIHWSIELAPRRNPNESVGPQIPLVGTGYFQIPSLAAADPINIYSQPLFDRLGRAVHRVYWGGLLLLGLIGAGLSARFWREVSLVWFLLLTFTLAYIAFHPATRYRAPSDPFVFLFSAYALVELARRLGLGGGRGKSWMDTTPP